MKTSQSSQKQLYPINTNRAMIKRPMSLFLVISMRNMPRATNNAINPMSFFIHHTGYILSHSIICKSGSYSPKLILPLQEMQFQLLPCRKGLLICRYLIYLQIYQSNQESYPKFYLLYSGF